MDYWVLAFYCLTEVQEPHLEVSKHKEFFKTRDLKSRIYISEQGINGQMSGTIPHAKEYMEWLRLDPRFANISFKIHLHSEQAFPKATIKYRRQLVAIDCDVDLEQRAKPVAPSEWKKMLVERDENTLVLDVRNTYEWEVGRFEGAELPPLETFRQFPSYAKQLKAVRDPKHTKVMMYCTGGIRCEFYSAVMKKEGFEQVYQLDGGVIQYGLEEGQNKWEGKLFVFDDRLVVSMSDEEVAPISACRHCGQSEDTYYNCANMDCNELFTCCARCMVEKRGTCCAGCQAAPRVRPIQIGSSKPFRKWDHEEKARMQPTC